MRSAEAAVSCLAVGSDDDVLVLCNDEQRTIADAICRGREGPGAERARAGLPAALAARRGAAARRRRGDGGA